MHDWPESLINFVENFYINWILLYFLIEHLPRCHRGEVI